MNGPDAVQRMREMGYTGVVVGVTGHLDQLTVDSFLSHGANKVMSKPFDLRDFEEYLQRQLA